MNQPMTPQARAAAIYGSLNAYVPYERCVSDKEFEQVEIDRREDIDDIVYLIQQTRRAALLEAAEFLKLMPMLTKDNAIAVLDRLASEGG